jgi:hypothetical protein
VARLAPPLFFEAIAKNPILRSGYPSSSLAHLYHCVHGDLAKVLKVYTASGLLVGADPHVFKRLSLVRGR